MYLVKDLYTPEYDILKSDMSIERVTSIVQSRWGPCDKSSYPDYTLSIAENFGDRPILSRLVRTTMELIQSTYV